jgi:hypothetical protein
MMTLGRLAKASYQVSSSLNDLRQSTFTEEHLSLSIQCSDSTLGHFILWKSLYKDQGSLGYAVDLCFKQ